MSDLMLTYRAWQFSLGLLPVPLYIGAHEENRHVLLNGTSGNFCLDEQFDVSPHERARLAWSSNTGHHLSTSRDFVEVIRWDQPEKIERFTAPSVAANLEEFHRHLERNTPDRLNNIISHALGVYRSLRSALHEEVSGTGALGAFLYLLCWLAVNKRPDEAERAILPNDAGDAFNRIGAADQEYFQERLSGVVGSFRMMRPDLTLLLRHASGALFQEAHAQVELPSMAWLPGFGPADALPVSNPGLATGAYFTPPSIARTLSEEALRQVNLATLNEIKIFDPACGSGELLKEALRILEIKGYQGRVALMGWDISGPAVAIARFSLGWEARDWNGRVTVQIECVDSVRSERWPSEVSVVLTNPPFRSWQQMDADERAVVIAGLGSLQANKPNLASVFIMRASQSLTAGGVLGAVAPRSLFEGDSSKLLRSQLADVLSLKVVANLSNTSLYQYAMVQSGFLVAKKEAGALEGPTVIWTDPQPTSPGKALRGLRRFQLQSTTPVSEESFSVYRNPDFANATKSWLPRPYSAWVADRVLRQRGNFVPAKQLYAIHQGARMGHDAFLIDRATWLRFSNEEQRFFRPAVTNSSLEQGRLSKETFVFYPYTDDLPVIDTEAALEAHVPIYYRSVLAPNKEALQARKSLEKAGQPWWGLIWPREWQYRPTKKLVSKYFGKRGSFSWDDHGEFVVVVGHGWVPKVGPKLWTHIDNEEYAHCVVAILASRVCETLLSQCSVQVGGGQWDLSSKYVGELLLPSPTRPNLTMIRNLAALGRQLMKSDILPWEQLDEAVAAAYGLPNGI